MERQKPKCSYCGRTVESVVFGRFGFLCVACSNDEKQHEKLVRDEIQASGLLLPPGQTLQAAQDNPFGETPDPPTPSTESTPKADGGAQEKVFKNHGLARPILEVLRIQAPLTEPRIKTALKSRLEMEISDSTLGKTLMAMSKCEPPMIRNERKGKNRGYRPAT